ncbi:MAG: UDP-N-acetylglucosamine 2-epimerase [Thermodesulfobacteriota bacterium]
MQNKRHICFYTGKRGGFNHLVPLLELISQDPDCRYSLIATDMHLSPAFGETINEVSRWAENVYTVETLMDRDSKVSRAKSIGIGIMGIADLLERLAPDLVLAVGDRGEVLALVICAVELNIPVVHLFGGDVSQGGVDEVVRHAITKMANLHLTSNNDSANRIIKMGEEEWRVHNVGSPVLDLIKQKRYTPPEVIRDRFKLNLDAPILVLLQHSVTWQVEQAEFQIRQTMEAIDSLGYQTVAIYPCSDPGCQDIIKVLQEYTSKDYFQLHKNVDFPDFWGLLNVARAFVGNSSAGLMEAPSFHLPFINIGIRQEGRLRADNVIDVDHDQAQISAALQQALFDAEFRAKVQKCASPYGDGRAAARILAILKQVRLDDKLIRKKMTY